MPKTYMIFDANPGGSIWDKWLIREWHKDRRDREITTKLDEIWIRYYRKEFPYGDFK